MLSFFSEDKGKKLFAIFDLDCDGQWDVKKTPTKEKKTFIWFGNEWLDVDKVDGLLSPEPTATKGEKEFEFHRGKWKLRRR